MDAIECGIAGGLLVDSSLPARCVYVGSAKSGGVGWPPSSAIRLSTKRCRSKPRPLAASRATDEWRLADARSAAACAAVGAPSATAPTKAAHSLVAERMVSVRPPLKCAIAHDSYVAPTRPALRWKASCSAA